MYENYYGKQSHPIRNTLIILVICLVVIIGLAVAQLLRPLPNPKLTSSFQNTSDSTNTNIRWPNTGEAAVAVSNIGEVGQYGTQTPVPIASLTKLMTAYLVLQKHPLGTGQNGPTLTMTKQDVQIYQKDNASGQSVMKVVSGEKLNERQMLEGLLLPSANNMATVLADWVGQDQSTFVQEMNQEAKSLGMTHTTYSDVSGANPASVSTSSDLLKIVRADMAIPAFKNIVAQPQATIPGAGTVYNVDYALGKDGIIGVKTGSSSEAGGAFAFAAQTTVAGTPEMIYGDVLKQGGMHELNTAFKSAESMIKSTEKTLKPITIVRKGQVVGHIKTAWNSQVDVVAGKTLTTIEAPGESIHYSLKAATLSPSIHAGETVGTAVIHAGSHSYTIPLKAVGAVRKPSVKWRLERL